MPTATKSQPRTVETEIQTLQKAAKKINKNRASARAFLLKHGFITKENKLAPRYR